MVCESVVAAAAAAAASLEPQVPKQRQWQEGELMLPGSMLAAAVARAEFLQM
jgi:hypothetical protein